MSKREQLMRRKTVERTIRRLILSWLIAATVEALLLPQRELSALEHLRQMSLLRLLLVMAAALLLFPRNASAERWGMAGTYALLAWLWLRENYTPAFFAACCLVLGVLTVYALRGWDDSPIPRKEPEGEGRYLWITVGLGVVFFLFLCLWTVCRVLSFSTPTYDFGIFAQMFHSMAKTGLPITTLERDGALSHFAVHVSPIYYLLLPGYLLFPHPITLQVMQALVVTSALIPLWLLGRHWGLTGLQRLLLCLVLMLSPAFGGGVGYDLHENCFLTPLLLWLFWFLDRGKGWQVFLTAALIWMVKEDAAVYVAVVGLWLLLRGDRRGAWLLAGSVGWFLLVTGFLAGQGDGVMTGRYDNFFYDGSGSLLTVIRAVALNPIKAVYECVDSGKLSYIALTMGPLLGLPLLTRRYERYVLLIPYLLVNLMSDYSYQHDIFFQYSFGSQALLIYLSLMNLADRKEKSTVLWTAVLVAAVLFSRTVVPKAMEYPQRLWNGREQYQTVSAALEQIPEGADVCTTTFYTVPLSDRDVLYDVKYASQSHMLECEYIVLDVADRASCRKYGGLEGLRTLLEEAGYQCMTETEYMLIYEKPPIG